MKATIEFNLPEDQYEYDTANNAAKYRSILWNIDQYLRNALKYGCDQCEDNKFSAFELVRKELHDLIEEEGVSLD